MEINKFPPVPMDPHQSYTSDGKPENVMNTNSLGPVNFDSLIDRNIVIAPAIPTEIVTTTSSPKKRKKKKQDENSSTEIAVKDSNTDVEKVNSREIVENTNYSDTYFDTTNMTYNIIGQADQLLRDCKQDLDVIRSQRSMKGKYHYINATVTTMTSLLATKLQAVKEINSTIKNVNDSEYRRFKDMRAMDAGDDNKAIMDAYSAFISAPVGAPQYSIPNTTAMTGGLEGIVRADLPPEVQSGMDAGMARYLSNLTPEETLMLNDSNKDIEEVIVYDQATGARKFQWMNTRTGEVMNNMPPSSNLTLEDFNIDLRTGLAKNNNLNAVKKVVVKNGSTFNDF